ncbi:MULTISPECIES: hypothetical protein [unclassified Streptomyces]|uniref:hypothetical protein n=1 Tax=unclassified Streptomyces TaxID=2593676 RepID=UPI000DC2620F|nr:MULTISPECIES: hypothetical protein [unclassified Streptomyces]MYT75327.1 hypothetical protein [Streptomyces sp. SID8367]RAJ86729.1 hypothetical protein K377_02409 [Streptomyces sp. PsTaAH-137]
MSAGSQLNHPSPGDLALFALEGDLSEAAGDHLRDCAPCRSTLAEFVRVTEAARAGTTGPVRPPAKVWKVIRDQL